MNNCTSLILKGFWTVPVLPLQYSPGRRREKNVTELKSLMAIFLAVVSWEAVSKACIMLIGRGCSLVGGESLF